MLNIPNTIDSTDALYTVLRSGLVVSGNSSISLIKEVTSGDALASMRVSGAEHLIALYAGRTETAPLLGGTFTEIADYVTAELWAHYTYANASAALTVLRRLVDDFKITIASGSFSNPARPYLTSESWPLPHEKQAKAQLVYRFRYLL